MTDTICCIASWPGVQGIPLCFDGHNDPCDDYGNCHACGYARAEVGWLCRRHYERALDAVAGWSSFRRALDEADGRLVSPEPGGRTSTAVGYTNLSASFLAVDECERHLASRADRTVDLWVHDQDGAADALRFTEVAVRAYGVLEVVEREQRVIRERCPGCGFITPVGNVTRMDQDTTIVACSFCGHTLAKIRPDAHRWVGSATCEHRMHAECDNLDCRCDCHTLGAQSRPGGVQALWDADQHTVSSRTRTGRAAHTWREPVKGRWITHQIRGTVRTTKQYRADWTVQDALTIQHTTERTAS